MSIHEVRKMIDEVDENRDGRLDYGEVRENQTTFHKALDLTTKMFYRLHDASQGRI